MTTRTGPARPATPERGVHAGRMHPGTDGFAGTLSGDQTGTWIAPLGNRVDRLHRAEQHGHGRHTGREFGALWSIGAGNIEVGRQISVMPCPPTAMTSRSREYGPTGAAMQAALAATLGADSPGVGSVGVPLLDRQEDA